MEVQASSYLERNRRLLLALIVGAMTVAVLLPGRPAHENQLGWREPGPGLRFNGPSQAMSERPITSQSGGLTLELWLAPGFLPGVGNQEIISFYDQRRGRPLLLGQFPRGLFLRGRADNPKGEPRLDAYIGIDEVGLRDASELSHLAVTVSGNGARLHVNGKRTSLALPRTIALPDTAFGGYLMLGRSDSGWRSWRGGILAVAIFDRELTQKELGLHAVGAELVQRPEFRTQKNLLTFYAFTEGRGERASNGLSHGPDLLFPKRTTPPTGSNFLSTRRLHLKGSPWLTMDTIQNVLGFIPLGFMICWRKTRRYWLLALALGFAFSLSIELLQSWIPGRSSSALDLASNSLGALVGGLIGWVAGEHAQIGNAPTHP